MAIIFYPIVGSRSNVCTSFWRPFSLGCYQIVTRWQGGLVGQNWATGKNGHNFWSDHWIALKSLHEFKLLILPLDRTQIVARVSVGCFSCGCYGIATRWWGGMVGQNWLSGQNAHNFWFDRRIALKFSHEFPDAVFLGVATEAILGDEEVWSANLE